MNYRQFAMIVTAENINNVGSLLEETRNKARNGEKFRKYQQITILVDSAVIDEYCRRYGCEFREREIYQKIEDKTRDVDLRACYGVTFAFDASRDEKEYHYPEYKYYVIFHNGKHYCVGWGATNKNYSIIFLEQDFNTDCAKYDEPQLNYFKVLTDKVALAWIEWLDRKRDFYLNTEKSKKMACDMKIAEIEQFAREHNANICKYFNGTKILHYGGVKMEYRVDSKSCEVFTHTTINLEYAGGLDGLRKLAEAIKKLK